MAAPTTAAEFLELVRKSQLLEDRVLDSYLKKAQEGTALPEDPAALALQLVAAGLLTRFQIKQLFLGKWKRFVLGKYKILDRLGSGGMGSVFLCEHKYMRRRVAIKVLPSSRAQSPSARERFFREARAVAALDHPNIVRAYDIDQDGELHYLIMEYIDGQSLFDAVQKSGPMAIEVAAGYIRQAALGLQHAHDRAGLVHRDIKPENILIDRKGVIKILDMGLARFFQDENDLLTQQYDEKVLGTIDYLAPEQLLDGDAVDIRADIYSLGATFYYCLAGQTLFGHGTAGLKRIWHQVRQPKPIRAIRPDIPEAIEQIIQKMIAKNPQDRYQRPIEVARALQAYAPAMSVAQAPTTKTSAGE
jgi:serine/threonine protein kinase